MIYIKEDIPQKISGVTSLFIKFDFNQEIIDILKSCDKYIFHKKLLCWELPITSLSYLLDNLTYIDDINLEILPKEENKEYFYPKLIYQYKTKPFEHQLEGIEFGLNKNSW